MIEFLYTFMPCMIICTPLCFLGGVLSVLPTMMDIFEGCLCCFGFLYHSFPVSLFSINYDPLYTRLLSGNKHIGIMIDGLMKN
jgi:hypothetical protein